MLLLSDNGLAGVDHKVHEDLIELAWPTLQLRIGIKAAGKFHGVLVTGLYQVQG